MRAYPALDRQVAVSTTGGNEAVWSRNGLELFYRWNGDIFGATFEPGRGTIGAPRKLLSGCPQLNVSRGFDVAADGRFILTKQAPEVDTSFHVVLGWDRELARLTKQ